MTAVTANQLRDREDGCRESYPVAASTKIYEKTLVFLDATGFATGSTAVGVNKFAGVSEEYADNSAGSNGDIPVEVHRKGAWPFIGTGFTQASVGKRAYAIDNNTVTTDGTTVGAVYCGIVSEYISTTKVKVVIDPHAAEQETIISVSIGLHATKVIYNLFTARNPVRVLNIDYVPDIAQGGALTATVVKATGTATPASATTPMHIAAAIDLNATAHTVQPITLSVTAADLALAAGERISLVLSAAMTVGSGIVTIRMRRD